MHKGTVCRLIQITGTESLAKSERIFAQLNLICKLVCFILFKSKDNTISFELSRSKWLFASVLSRLVWNPIRKSTSNLTFFSYYLGCFFSLFFFLTNNKYSQKIFYWFCRYSVESFNRSINGCFFFFFIFFSFLLVLFLLFFFFRYIYQSEIISISMYAYRL